jgi:hypothetical protein
VYSSARTGRLQEHAGLRLKAYFTTPLNVVPAHTGVRRPTTRSATIADQCSSWGSAWTVVVGRWAWVHRQIDTIPRGLRLRRSEGVTATLSSGAVPLASHFTLWGFGLTDDGLLAHNDGVSFAEIANIVESEFYDLFEAKHSFFDRLLRQIWTPNAGRTQPTMKHRWSRIAKRAMEGVLVSRESE